MVRQYFDHRVPVFAGIFLVCIFFSILPVAAEGTWFDVRSDPSDAYVCVDNYQCSYTPATFPETPYTWHTITVSKEGYQPWSSYEGTGSPGTTVVIANLVRNPSSVGWLDINPFEAEVIIDGIDEGNGAMIIPLSPGTHNLLLQKSGYYDYKDMIIINAGKTLTYAHGMTPYTQSSGYGDLQISSNPAGASVYVNNYYKGITSSGSALYVTQLAPGTYTVRLTMPDYQPYTETATVQNGITYDIWATMVPVTPGPTPDTTGQINVGSSPAGANVYLDNGLKGFTPTVLADIPAGSHTITLRMIGYQDWSSTVNVAAGSYTQVSGNLVPAVAPTTPAPQPTKSGLFFAIALCGIGICGALVVLKKRM